MELFHAFVLVFVTLCNLYLGYVAYKYRKMFLEQCENFRRMHILVEQYQKLYELEKQERK